MRGFGHVKDRNVQAALTRQAWLLHRLDPIGHPKPRSGAALHQLHGVTIRSIPS
jgi:hypothetical protein